MADLQQQNLIFDTDKLDVKLKNRIIYKAIDEVWLEKIESTLPSLDKAVRKPTRYIEETDKVLNIEQSRNITARSIRDLAVHSDYIKDIDENGDILPSKILNVFRDETTDTYENRFINTLIFKLYDFVKKRYDKLSNMTVDSKTTIFNFDGEFKYNGVQGKTNLSIEIQNDNLDENSTNESLASSRVRKVYYAILDYMNCSFCKELGNKFVRPPVVRTNALLKNPDLRTCLALWEFIEGYEDVGYEALINEKEDSCSNEVLEKMLESIKQQCVLFDELINGNDLTLDGEKESKYKPKFIKDETIRVDNDFDIRDSEYKSIVEIVDNIIQNKELSDTEKDIDLAVKLALELAQKEEDEFFEKLKRKSQMADFDTWFSKLKRINRSYLSRLIQLNDEQKEFYFTIKNHILKYTKVKSRISWHHELFNVGRKKVACFVVRGKTLCINLALDPNMLDSKYHVIDESDKTSKVDMPSLLKIRSNRAVKYACELIDRIMQECNCAITDREQENLSLPYQTDEELLNAGLIKIEDKNVDGKPYDEFFVKGENEPENEEFDITDEKFWYSDLARINRSFISRIIQLNDESKEFYSQIKNTLLGYKKVKNRVSWHHEAFTLGRTKLAKIVVRGKTLCLNLALDPKNVDEKYHAKDQSDIDSKKELPLLLKIRSQRAVKYAQELIAIMMEEQGIIAIEREQENYVLPYQTDKELYKAGLIKIDEKKAQVEEQDQAQVDKVEQVEQTQEQAEEMETVESSAKNEEFDITDEKFWYSDLARINRSFISRIIQLNDESKEFYSQIKNTLLGYKKVKNRVSWHHEAFTLGRTKLAKIVVRGKTLCLNLALDPKNVDEKYHAKDQSEIDSKKELPLLLKIRSQRAVKYAQELIAMMMEEQRIIAIEREQENYVLPYQTDKELYKAGLIKIDEKKVQVEEQKQEKVDQVEQAEQTQEQAEETETVESDAENDETVAIEEIAISSESNLEDNKVDETNVNNEQENVDNALVYQLSVDLSNYPDIVKYFKKEDILALIGKIKNETATSVFEQVETEVLMCYKIISQMGFFSRRKYAKIFKGNDIDLILKKKEKLLSIYMKKFDD